MAQASQVLAVATPSEGHRATTEGTGSEKRGTEPRECQTRQSKAKATLLQLRL